MNKFYFNTGVKFDHTRKLFADHVWRNGTMQIPFECEAPENAELLFCCGNPNLPESKLSHVVVCEIHNSSMVSKYAYFRV